MAERSKHIKAPFRADFMGGIVFNADGFHFADVRGWGQLQYEKDAAKTQDEHLQYMVDALNEKWARENRCQSVWRAGVLRPPGEHVTPDGARCVLVKHTSSIPHQYEAKNERLYEDTINSVAERNRKDREG